MLSLYYCPFGSLSVCVQTCRNEGGLFSLYVSCSALSPYDETRIFLNCSFVCLFHIILLHLYLCCFSCFMSRLLSLLLSFKSFCVFLSSLLFTCWFVGTRFVGTLPISVIRFFVGRLPFCFSIVCTDCTWNGESIRKKCSYALKQENAQ